MSRCFTFPPPGYEKKNIIDDIDLLTKEKRKEKKHKKDKDRDKKESKDKKDKERSKEKRRGKKDHKEKRKDRKHREEKDGCRENGSSNSKHEPEVQLNSINGARLNSNVLQTQNHDSGNPNRVQELARRIRVEAKATGSQIGQKTSVTDQEKINGTMDSNHLQVLAKRVGNEEKNASGGKILQKIRFVDQGKAQMPIRTDDKNGCLLPEPNGKETDKQGNDSMVICCKNFRVAKNFNSAAAYGEYPKPIDRKDVRKEAEGKDKARYNKEIDCKIDKPRKKDREKKSKSKDKDRDEEKEKEEKAKEMDKLSNGQPKVIKGGSNLNDACDIKRLEVLAESGKILAGEGNLGKRNELEINGLLRENGSRPHKLQRPAIFSQVATQNGRKLEFCLSNDCKADSKLLGIKNWLIDAPLRKVISQSPPLIAIEAGENGEVSMRPPHPDSIRLSQILSLPEIDKVPDFDDQEWLFCNRSRHGSSNMLETDSSERQLVQNQAIKIKSADIYALPYVVPY